MPLRMLPIEYVGGINHNDYMLTSSLDTPYAQQLNENDSISSVLISESISLAEISQYTVISTSAQREHPYMVPVNGELDQYSVNVEGEDVYVYADKMPKQLVGWQAKNKTNNTYEDFTDTTLTRQTIDKYGNNGEIALYGKWENVHLIRSILFIPLSTMDIACSYNISISTQNSYSTRSQDDYYPLQPNYKSIVDYGNPEYKKTIDYYQMLEYGNGDGCLKEINNTYYPSYFSVKANDNINLELHLLNGDYIPVYEMVVNPQSPKEHIPEYHYYTTSALRCDVNGWEKNAEKHNLTRSAIDGNYWYSSNSIKVISDLTLICPLIKKPLVVITTSPDTNEFFAYFGSTTIPPEQQIKERIFMPNETCTVYTYSTNRNAVLSGWYIDGGGENAVAQTNPYTFKVEYLTHMVARWVPQTPPQAQPTVILSYLLHGTTLNSSLTNPNGTVQYTTDGTTWTNLTNTTPVTVQATTNNDVVLRAPINGTGNQGTIYQFVGFRQYRGNIRNPLEDFDLSSGGFWGQGGSYVSEGITNPYVGYQLIMSNLTNGSTYKVYAVYEEKIV